MTDTIQANAAAPDADDFTDLDWSVPRAPDHLSQEHILSGSLGGFRAVTDLASCLLPLLNAMEWEGETHHISEALPHFADQLDLTDFLNVMASLGYSSRSLDLTLAWMDARLAPCLFVPDSGPAQVVVKREGDTFTLFDPQTLSYEERQPGTARGKVFVFQPQAERGGRARSEQDNFVGGVVKRFRPLLLKALGISLAANILVLGTPIFIMGVYDRVVATGSRELLIMMAVGVMIALLGDFFLKSLRSRMISYIGARLDHILGTAVFGRLTGLSPAYTEMANISSQVARLKDFEVVREFFTGPLATVIFEIPFSLVFLLFMAVLAGPLVFVPIGAALIYVAIGFLVLPRIRASVAEAGRTGSRRQEFLVETLSKMRDIKTTYAEDVWVERYRVLSADAALAADRSARISTTAGGLSQVLIMLAGLVTLAWGVFLALAGSLSVGGLVASMIIVWWVLRPLQTGFSTLSQIERMRDSVSQINRLMQVPAERSETPQGRRDTVPQGKVSISNVSMRYVADADPAVAGINLTVEPGELVAVVGSNGSGKSTLLKLILGMYRPQAGTVRIDDIDLRQMDPVELRRGLSYVPQGCEVFFGSVAQNLRLAKPTASDRELFWACREAGCLEDVQALPEGFDTRLGDGRSQSLPSNLVQRLSLARAYLKRAPIMLMDEPANGLDFAGDQQLMKVLQRMRGNTTVFLVTHRPSHLRLADKVVVLHQGQVRMAGPAKQVLDRLAGTFF